MYVSKNKCIGIKIRENNFNFQFTAIAKSEEHDIFNLIHIQSWYRLKIGSQTNRISVVTPIRLLVV